MKANKIKFEKFHAAGNDFIIVDDRNLSFPSAQEKIARMCHRHFGIGADGLILLQNHKDVDFEMIYYNSDGLIGSMCGNGGRCSIIFSRQLGMVTSDVTFLAYDGIHKAKVTGNDLVRISMNTVSKVEKLNEAFVLNTGSPHYVVFTDNLNFEIAPEARKIRNNETYREKGINVNFARIENGDLFMRTYERGVESETLACGTGTVATAIAASLYTERNELKQSWIVHALGGDLKVDFSREQENLFSDVWLEGIVTHVFRGEMEI
ncbi:MAG: diaminopimelate epimerase [Chitinophagales bacterium]|nr:diaminopimelate epimerase [Chitinophagales bacterium]